MPGATNVRIETRYLPSGDEREISARRYATASLSDHEGDLQAAIQGVLASVTKAVTGAQQASPPAKVGGVEIAFNVAFTEAEGAYLCSSDSDATFAVKLSLTL